MSGNEKLLEHQNKVALKRMKTFHIQAILFLVLTTSALLYSAPFDYEKIDKDCRKMYDGGRMGIHTEYVGEIVNVFVNDANR